MTNDRDSQSKSAKGSTDKQTDQSGKRVIGRGMTSPDSTQVPLRAEDGEPDMDAINGRIPPDDGDDDSASKRRN
ncbi:MAG: hypothetical protein JWM41_936 [Gemmatimonadetes bacterium]|nr:hypothetical protein [Gemmatimonadota bacterium]